MRAGSNLMGFGFPDKWVETGHNCSWQWYDEEKDYDYNNPGYQDKVAHFTQVVWRDTARIGCAFAACLNVTTVPGRLFCCKSIPKFLYMELLLMWRIDYDPVGNWLNPGMFEQNVWPPHSCPE